MTDLSVIKVGQLSIRYLLDGARTGTMGMFELTVPPGSNVPPPHSHSHNEECVYVLEGTLRYSVGDVTRDLGSGGSMFTPKGTVHQFSNPFSARRPRLDRPFPGYWRAVLSGCRECRQRRGTARQGGSDRRDGSLWPGSGSPQRRLIRECTGPPSAAVDQQRDDPSEGGEVTVPGTSALAVERLSEVSPFAGEPARLHRRRTAFSRRQPWTSGFALRGLRRHGSRFARRHGGFSRPAGAWPPPGRGSTRAVHHPDQRGLAHLSRAVGHLPTVRRLRRVAPCAARSHAALITLCFPHHENCSGTRTEPDRFPRRSETSFSESRI